MMDEEAANTLIYSLPVLAVFISSGWSEFVCSNDLRLLLNADPVCFLWLEEEEYVFCKNFVIDIVGDGLLKSSRSSAFASMAFLLKSFSSS